MKSVTAVLNEQDLGNKGISGMFERTGSKKVDGNSLSQDSKITDRVACGNLLEYLIEKYLVDNIENFELRSKPEDQTFKDEKYGVAAWGLMKSMVTEYTARLLEQPISGYGATGRADCILIRIASSTIIDFKWTAANYPDPSPRYALQLLLYQWMEGQTYKEKEGADMYLIRYCADVKEMQLFKFTPPADMQYSEDNKTSVKTYVDICKKFRDYYSLKKKEGKELVDGMTKLNLDELEDKK